MTSDIIKNPDVVMNIIKNVHAVAQLRRELGYFGEPRYIKTERQLLEVKCTNFFGQLFRNAGVNVQSHSWVENLENMRDDVVATMISPHGSTIASLAKEFRDLKVKCLSALIGAKVQARKQKRRQKKTNVGLVFDNHPGVALEMDGDDEWDFDDIDAVFCVSDDIKMNRALADSNVKLYTIPKSSCKELGIPYPATCYVKYH